MDETVTDDARCEGDCMVENAVTEDARRMKLGGCGGGGGGGEGGGGRVEVEEEKKDANLCCCRCIQRASMTNHKSTFTEYYIPLIEGKLNSNKQEKQQL